MEDEQVDKKEYEISERSERIADCVIVVLIAIIIYEGFIR